MSKVAKKSPKNKTCPQCKGDKQITVTVSEFGKSGDHSFKMDCITCNGAGKVTAEQARAHKAMADAWCTCDEPGDPDYHPDGNDICGKHCYTCSNCGKILQVG